MKIISKAPAKVILFGEHFVVHNQPGLVASIKPFNVLKLEFIKSSSPALIYNSTIKSLSFKFFPNLNKNSKQKFKHFLEYLYFNLLEKNEKLKNYLIKAHLSNCWELKGVGNSSSIAAAFFTGVQKFLRKKFSKKKVFEYVQLSDTFAHKKPSGIDAAAVSFGGILEFKKPLKLKKIKFKIPKKYLFLLVDTFIKDKKRSQTKSQIKKFSLNNGPSLCSDYKKIFIKAKKALSVGDIKKLGKLMRANHLLLKKSAMSSLSIEKAINILQKNNSLGEKLTGAGGVGGAVIALIYKKDYNKIKKELEKNGFRCFEFKIVNLDN
jgi:mevalonate kinase